MRPKFFASSFFTAVLLLAAALVFGRPETSAPAEDSRQVLQLLEDIKTQAADLQRDSEELESFTHSNMSWESHADELSRIRDRINTIGHTIEKLKKMRNNASPWQQEAIDRIIPVTEQLGFEHYGCDPTPEQRPATLAGYAVSAVSEIELRGSLTARRHG